MTLAGATERLPAVAPRQLWVIGFAVLLLAATVWNAASFGWRPPVLAIIGAGLGIALYFATFGFASAYRHLFTHGETRGAQAQILLLILTMLIFAPILTHGTFMGDAVTGAIAPAGVQVAVGAFLFGVGMQLGGGCASGTLYTAGSGNLRMAVTLAAFCAGAFWASLHLGFWTATPHLPAIALGDEIGWPVAVGLQSGVLALAWFGLRRLERKWGHDATTKQVPKRFQARLIWYGPWPLAWGVIALGLLNGATLVVAQHPWVITWGYTLWGAKAAVLAGWQPMAGDIWSAGPFQAALAASPFADSVSIMNIGIMIGALLAVGLAGNFAPEWRVPPRSLAAALFGGLLLGYGARIAFGCNIGAFISGIASTSLHGWLWILCALPGNWVGIRLRPVFGLEVSCTAKRR